MVHDLSINMPEGLIKARKLSILPSLVDVLV